MKSDSISRIFLGIFVVLWLVFSGLIYYVHNNYEKTKSKFKPVENKLVTTVNEVLDKKKRLIQLSNLIGYHESYDDKSLDLVYNYVDIKKEKDTYWNKMRTSIDSAIAKVESIANNDDSSVVNKIALGLEQVESKSIVDVDIDKNDLMRSDSYNTVTLENLWDIYELRIVNLQEKVKNSTKKLEEQKKIYNELVSNERASISKVEQAIQDKKQEIDQLRTEKSEFLREKEEERDDAQDKNSEERNKLSRLNDEKRVTEQEYEEKLSDLDQRISELKDEAAGQSGIEKWFQDQKRQVKQSENADGEIFYVNQKLKIAYIDIGRPQGVVPGLKFDVFRFGKGGQKIIKGKIEVKKVRDNMSMVGVVEVTNDLAPITSGDRIINTVYDKNKTKYFVVAGDLVQKYSLQQVKRMISDIGGRIESEITAKTDFVILAENFEDDAIFTRAEQLGIETMLENEFINHLDNWQE